MLASWFYKNQHMESDNTLIVLKFWTQFITNFYFRFFFPSTQIDNV